MPQRSGCRRFRQFDWPPPDLLDPGGINFRTERAGDELGAKANAEGRPPGCKAGCEKIDFVSKKWIFVFFINANGCAKDNKKIGCCRVSGRERMNARVVIPEFIPCCAQRLSQSAEILEMNVPYDGCGFHRHGISSGWPVKQVTGPLAMLTMFQTCSRPLSGLLPPRKIHVPRLSSGGQFAVPAHSRLCLLEEY